MASEVQVGVLKLIGAVDTTGIKEGLSKMNGLVQGFSKRISGIGSGLTGLGGLTVGLAGAAAAASTLTTALDIEDQTVGLGKAANLSGDQLKAFRDDLINLGTELRGIRTDEIIEIATAGAKLGVSNDQLIAYTKNIAMLSTAIDDMDAGEISNSMGVLTNLFGLDAADGALKLGSALDALGDSSTTNVPALMDVLSRAGGNAKLLGLTAAETAALSTALLNTGTSAEKAGGALGRTFLKLSDLSQAGNFAAQMGVSKEDWVRMLQDDPLSAIQGFLSSMQGLDLSQVTERFNKVGITSPEDIAELAKLTGQVGQFSQFLAIANEQMQTGAQAQDSYAASSNTTRARLDQLINQFTQIAIMIADVILPVFNTFLDYISPWVKTITDHLKNLPVYLEVLALQWTQRITNMIATIKTLPENLKIIGEWIGGNWLNMIRDAFVGLETMVANVAKNFGKFLESVWKGIRTGNFEFEFTPLLEGFTATTESLPEMVKPALIDLQDEIDKVSAKLIESPTANIPDAVGVAQAIISSGENNNPSIPSVAPKEQLFATNLVQGSVEAYRAEARFRSGFNRDGAQQQIAQNTSNQLIEARKQTKILKDLSSNALTALPI